jgi:hypothetical protein
MTKGMKPDKKAILDKVYGSGKNMVGSGLKAASDAIFEHYLGDALNAVDLAGNVAGGVVDLAKGVITGDMRTASDKIYARASGFL